MFDFNPEDQINETFFRRAIKSYADLCAYIKDANRTPISTYTTREILDRREIIYEQGIVAREYARTLNQKMADIHKNIKEVKNNVTTIDGLVNCTKIEMSIEQVEKKVDYDVTQCTICKDQDSICHVRCTCPIEAVTHPDVKD